MHLYNYVCNFVMIDLQDNDDGDINNGELVIYRMLKNCPNK